MVQTRLVETSPDNQRLSDAEVADALHELRGWSVEAGKLQRQFTFSDFGAAIAFMVEVAFDAERLEHHPNWSNVYNRVEVAIYSHDLGGISQRCVALAKAMDAASAPQL